MKTNGKTTTAATADYGITTGGEVFADGVMIELIRGAHLGNPQLMLWGGSTEIMAPALEYNGQRYEPAEIEKSVLQQLMLPTRCCPHGTTRDFLTETCTLIVNLVGLDEKAASLVGRIVLCSAIIDAVPVAPDTARAHRLMSVLRCLCRHSVPVTSVTPASFCSLANGVRYTFLISQANISQKLQKLLDDASRSDRKILFRGRLLDLFGVQVIQSESVFPDDPWPLRSIRVSMVPTETALPAFDKNAQRLIATEFQGKLLSFRRANLGAAQRLDFDASKFSLGLRDLARSLAAATPDDVELQAEVFELLREEDAESRSARWIDLSVIAVEAVLVAYHESSGEAVYVSELSNIGQALLKGRGEDSTIYPGAFGKRLKLLGFVTEPRDANGKKIRLTEAVYNRARQLARDLDIPEPPELGRTEVSHVGMR